MTQKLSLSDAVGVLVSAAEARRDQWQGVAEGKSPDDLVDDLWESASTGCLEAESMVDLVQHAIDVVRESRRPVKIRRVECAGVGDNNGFFEASAG